MFEEKRRIRLAAEQTAEIQNKKLDALLAEMESRREDSKVERRMLFAMLEKMCPK